MAGKLPLRKTPNLEGQGSKGDNVNSQELALRRIDKDGND